MKEPVQKFILLVLIFQITTIAMQIYAIGQDTWWYCDVTVEAPILNLTSRNSVHMTKISIKMRTSFEETCWYVKQEEQSTVVDDVLITGRITKCLTSDLHSLDLTENSYSINVTEDANANLTEDSYSSNLTDVKDIGDSKAGMQGDPYIKL